MPKKIEYDEFIKRCKDVCKDFANISFEFVNKDNFDYCKQQKFLCKKHNKVFFRTPKSILKNCDKRNVFICNDCRLEYIKPNLKNKNISKPNSGKLIKYSYNDIAKCLKVKNPNISLVSPTKDIYTNKDILKLKCNIHGIFQKRVGLVFRSKWICNKCNTKNSVEINIKKGEERRKNFINKAIQVHGDEYDYSKVDTSGKLDKISIVCKIHGEFLQMPSLHLRGEGCPLCTKEGISNNERRLGYCLRKRFPNLEILQQWNGNILKRQKLDYYIPKYRIGIEYQGPQHFIDVDWFNDYRHNLEHRKNLDKTKYEICKSNNIKVLYFTFNKEFDNIKYLDKVYTSLGELYDNISEIIDGFAK